MVNMGMGQTYRIDGARSNGQFAIFIYVHSLFHAAVDEYLFSTGLQKCTGAGDLMGRT